jgi:hypothetical protein
MLPDEVPRLDLAMQADGVVPPVVKWGSIARSSRVDGTYHFYAEDRQFTGLWKEPDRLPASGCRVAVECNFSTWPGMPRDELMRGIYRKRWLARHWQSEGVRILVDLNVDPAFRDVALMGVPDGWSAYAVRHQRGISLAEIEADHRMACDRAGHDSILFVVFGGWKKVRDLCEGRGWTWQGEDLHAIRGSTDGTRTWR